MQTSRIIFLDRIYRIVRMKQDYALAVVATVPGGGTGCGREFPGAMRHSCGEDTARYNNSRTGFF
jgi:hypothetical protein